MRRAEVAAKFDAEEEAMASENNEMYKVSTISDYGSVEEDLKLSVQSLLATFVIIESSLVKGFPRLQTEAFNVNVMLRRRYHSTRQGWISSY